MPWSAAVRAHAAPQPTLLLSRAPALPTLRRRHAGGGRPIDQTVVGGSHWQRQHAPLALPCADGAKHRIVRLPPQRRGRPGERGRDLRRGPPSAPTGVK